MYRRWIGAAIAAVLALGITIPLSAQNRQTELLWLGQAAFKITTPGGKTIVIDPWLKANPTTPAQYKNLDALGKVDVLLVTHGHGDHLGDAPALAKMHNVKMYAPADMNSSIVALGILPADLAPRFNKTGTVEPAPGIKVTAVRADHSSVIVWPNPATGKDEVHTGGEPIGYIIELENGFRIWHMGDTGLFTDMKFIAEYYKPDVVLAPIGGNFTMGPADAAYAMKEWIKPKVVIPMHYASNPLLKGTPAEFQEAMKGSSAKIIALKQGESTKF